MRVKQFLSTLTLALGLSTSASAFDYEGYFTSAIAADLRSLPYNLQDEASVPNDCAPIFRSANPGLEFRGTVVVFHGYTACPQQFYELAGRLADQGFNTYVPLLPGQGRGPVPDGSRFVGWTPKHKYYSRYLPTHKDWARYQDFVAGINQRMKGIPGPKMVAGLSVGGGLANYAYQESEGLYQKALMFAPYYGMPGSYAGRDYSEGGSASDPFAGLKRLLGDSTYYLQRTLIRQGSYLSPLLGELPVSWGEGCYEEGKDGAYGVGRRGICDFRFTNLAAVDRMGEVVLQGNADLKVEKAPQIQYVLVEFDDGADTRLQRLAVEGQRNLLGADQVGACFYGDGIPHSFISRQDNRGTDMYWLDSFFAQVENFLVAGEKFQLQVGASKEVEIDPVTGRDTRKPMDRCAIF